MSPHPASRTVDKTCTCTSVRRHPHIQHPEPSIIPAPARPSVDITTSRNHFLIKQNPTSTSLWLPHLVALPRPSSRYKPCAKQVQPACGTHVYYYFLPVTRGSFLPLSSFLAFFLFSPLSFPLSCHSHHLCANPHLPMSVCRGCVDACPSFGPSFFSPRRGAPTPLFLACHRHMCALPALTHSARRHPPSARAARHTARAPTWLHYAP